MRFFHNGTGFLNGETCLFFSASSRRARRRARGGVSRRTASAVVIGRAVIVRVVVRSVAVGVWKRLTIKVRYSRSFALDNDTKIPMHSFCQLTMIGRTGARVGSTGRVVVVALAVVAGARRVVTSSAGHV